MLEPGAPNVNHGMAGNSFRQRNRTLLVRTVQDNIGCIAFSAEGLPVGVYVMKQRQGSVGAPAQSALANLDSARAALLQIIRPIDDVIEVAEQAKKRGAQGKP